MATKLSAQGFLKLFTTGQGAGAGTYDQYAPDLDFNFGLLESTVDTIIDELRAIAGPNSLVQIDLITSTSPAVATGKLDANSFAASFLTTTVTDDTIRIQPGSAYTGVGRRELTALKDMVGSGVSGTRWVALQDDGDVTLETAASQGIMDLWSVTWNGTAFTTSTLANLVNIMPAGDDFQNCLRTEDVATAGAGLPDNATYQSISNKLRDIDRILKGSTTSVDPGAFTLGRIAISGTAAAPGLVLSNGTTPELTSGLYRAGANQFGVAIEGVSALIWDIVTAGNPQQLQRAGTLLGAPPYSWSGDADTGFGYLSANQFRAIVGGQEALRFVTSGGFGQTRISLNDDANPGLAAVGDPNTGMRPTAADTWAVITGGIQANTWNPQQQRNSSTQGRVSATRTTQNVASGTALTNISLTTAEQYDQGDYHDLVTNPDRFTVPTGHGGNFGVKATCTFDESTSTSPNVGDRALAITVNGTTVAESRTPAAGANDTSLSVAIDVTLAATDIVRMAVSQDSGGTMDVVNSRLTLRHED